MQRAGSEAVRGPGSKRGGGRRGSTRRVLSVVCSPLAAVALFAALLLYSSHRFSYLSSTGASAGEGSFFDGRSGSAGWQHAGDSAAGARHAAEARSGHSADSDALASLQQRAQQQQPHRSSWLTAALLWAEEHHAARLKAKVRPGPCGGCVACSLTAGA